MPEFYGPRVLEESLRLYEDLSSWARPRDDVTVIGGWAVHELVRPEVASQSRDVDLVIHTREGLLDFSARLAGWGLAWRQQGRNRFNDCHRIGDPRRAIVVDVFKGHGFEDPIFRGPRVPPASTVKPLAATGFLPSLGWLVQDKVDTIPLRQRDVEDKRLKDLLDIYHLAFFNRQNVDARTLADAAPSDRRRALAPYWEAARRHDRANYRSAFQEELDNLRPWLDL